MDSNLNKIAQDLYGKIQTRFKDINIGDENAEVLSKKEDIPRARFFEFEYEEDGESLGTIAITLDPEDGIVMQVSGDLVDDESKSTRHRAFKFIRGFRQFAKDRLLNFDVQNIGKSNLDKRDYEFQAKRKEMPIMPAIMENKLYGNNRVSYQDLGDTRLIIKHSQQINMDLPAGRTMHIESIYIENNQGERFKYPYRHINGARALAEHIGHGGNPYDNIGRHICGLSEELAGLRKFKGYVSRQEQLSEAMSSVTERVINRIEEIKETINKLQRTSYYEEFVENFQEQDEQMIPEEVQNDLIDRLTIRTFNEELKSVFPYIYKFVDENELPVVELTADDILEDNNEKCDDCGEPVADCECPGHEHKTDESFDIEKQFESYIDDLVNEDKNEILSPNEGAKSAAIEKLNDILAQNLQVGPNGDNAVMTLKGLIDHPSFIEAVKSVPAETDLNDIIRGWIETEHEDLLDQLTFPSDENASAPEAPPEPAPAEPAPAPAEPAPPAPAAGEVPPELAEPAADAGLPANPAPPAPVAEAKKDDSPPWDVDPKDKKSKPVTPGKHGQGYSQARHLARQGMANAMKKAKDAGATLETQLDLGDGIKTIAEIIKDCGMKPTDFGFETPTEGGLEGMLKFVSGFYDTKTGKFPLGAMRIKIKLKKAFEDGMFDGATEEDLIKVLKFIDMKDPGGDESDRIMQLAGIEKKTGRTGFDVGALEDQMNQMSLQFNESLKEYVAVQPNTQNASQVPSAAEPAATNTAPASSMMSGRDIMGRPVMKGSPNDITSNGATPPAPAPAPADAPPAPAPAPADAPPAPAPAPTAPKNRDSMTFGQAFADARKLGEKTFPWRGKQYGTQLASQQSRQVATQPGEPKTAYRDPDQGGQGGQNALWLNQKFPKAQPGQEYWVKGTRYEKGADGWYRTFEKSDWFAKPINRQASNLGYTGPTDDASMQAWVAKNRPKQQVTQADIPIYEESTGYDEVQRLISLVHHR